MADESPSKDNNNASGASEAQEALQVIEAAQKANPNLFKGLNNKQKQELVKGIAVGITHIQKSHSGPLPDPETLSQYSEIIPDGAERIMQMAEKEQNFRHGHTRNVAKRKLDQETRGQWFAFILAVVCIIGGIYLTVIGKDTAGMSVIIGSIATLVGAFLVTKVIQSKQPKD